MPARDIESIDCELAVYRKGFLSVHINLSRGYLTWRESNCWTNNFTRSLRPEQIDQIRRSLMESNWILKLPELLEHPVTTGRLLTDDSPDTNRSSIAWSLCLKTPEGFRRGTGSSMNTLPEGLNPLKQTIESISRLPFALR
ncbi:MAG: hypothetical protein PHC86_00510 [Eubacteriales bacterium]|nr:hypothetical protein [Eubacteriales bacterium]